MNSDFYALELSKKSETIITVKVSWLSRSRTGPYDVENEGVIKASVL